MTAEVVVMNRNGLALAADSAVSIGYPEAKIYNSANKLFQLSAVAPVGIMVYGGANLMEVPWETVIKIFRSNLGHQIFPKLKGYGPYFVSFLKQNRALFPEESQARFVTFVAENLFRELRNDFFTKLEKAFSEHKDISQDDASSILRDVLNEALEEIQEFPRLSTLGDDFPKEVRARYEEQIRAGIEKIFEEFPIADDIEETLFNILIDFFSHHSSATRVGYSGVVLGGFGEEEHFPSIIEYLVIGMVADHLLYDEVRNAAVSSEIQAYIAPFAQREMVDTFIEGIDPDLHQFIEETTDDLFYQVATILMHEVREFNEDFGNELQERTAASLQNLLPKLHEQWQIARRERYTDPVMEMVASLPKDELGGMAESLVNLTKFKRRISRQQESVGGPIDVAVITKGDGFVWMKRKHYFSAELNPRYFARIHGRSRNE